MGNLATHFNTTFNETSQSQPIPGREKDMAKNNAGGYSFKISDWDRLNRFLVLGTDGGTYYTSEKSLTVENAKCIINLLSQDGIKVVDKIVEISHQGRAPRNSAALFALALCSSPRYADKPTRVHALDNLNKVARIGTHLFEFLANCKVVGRGGGRKFKEAVQDWYEKKLVEKLSLQLVKYRQRGGWTHRDVLRLVRPKAKEELHNNLYGWAVKGNTDFEMPRLIEGFEKLKSLDIDTNNITKAQVKEAAKIVADYKLPHEAIIPTELKNERVIWEALLPDLPMMATIRNLNKLSSVGLLKPLSEAERVVKERLSNEKALSRARIHPLNILSAMMAYNRGYNLRYNRDGSATSGNMKWSPVQTIVDTLDEAFYSTFGNVKPTGKKWILALDISGSMVGPPIAGVGGISPREGSAAMALITAAIEQQYVTVGFTSNNNQMSTAIKQLNISPRMRLDTVIKNISNLPFGGTDCALPMLWAIDNKIEADVFVIYTDNETWAGNIQPVQALKQYQQKMGIDAKLIVVGMTSTGFSIADPNANNMLDVVGFDTSVPQVMANFVKE